jgi:hypothetical protein
MPRRTPVGAAMNLLLVFEGLDGTYVEVRRARLRDLLAARLNGAALDRRLAAGASPDASPSLALRARMLRRPAERRGLAARLREIVGESERPRPVLSSRIPVARMSVRRASADLLELADRLAAADPVSVRGVARVRVLLSDGLSPVYSGRSNDDLVRVVRVAIEELEPRPWRSFLRSS